MCLSKSVRLLHFTVSSFAALCWHSPVGLCHQIKMLLNDSQITKTTTTTSGTMLSQSSPRARWLRVLSTTKPQGWTSISKAGGGRMWNLSVHRNFTAGYDIMILHPCNWLSPAAGSSPGYVSDRLYFIIRRVSSSSSCHCDEMLE